MAMALLTTGLACLIAAIVGGGLRAFGIEIPVLKAVARQTALAILGAGLVYSGFRAQPKKDTANPAPTPMACRVSGVV